LRQEDKEVDGPEIEQAEERKRESELVEEKGDELYDLDGLPEREVESKRAEDMMSVMRTILAREQIVINDLKLPKRQLTALEALKAAVDGKDTRLSRFVYAEDRRTLLEQALAVLQPELATMQGAKEFQEMFAKVGELREKLNVLEDAEEELVEGRAKDHKEESDTDDEDDEEGDKDDDDDDDDQSLTGPERKQKPKGPTTLGDIEEIEKVAAESAPTSPRWRRTGDG
jgi:hypothetical protein